MDYDLAVALRVARQERLVCRQPCGIGQSVAKRPRVPHDRRGDLGPVHALLRGLVGRIETGGGVRLGHEDAVDAAHEGDRVCGGAPAFMTPSSMPLAKMATTSSRPAVIANTVAPPTIQEKSAI